MSFFSRSKELVKKLKGRYKDKLKGVSETVRGASETISNIKSTMKASKDTERMQRLIEQKKAEKAAAPKPKPKPTLPLPQRSDILPVVRASQSTPQPVTPQPIARQPITPQSTVPQSIITPQSTASKPITPQVRGLKDMLKDRMSSMPKSRTDKVKDAVQRVAGVFPATSLVGQLNPENRRSFQAAASGKREAMVKLAQEGTGVTGGTIKAGSIVGKALKKGVRNAGVSVRVRDMMEKFIDYIRLGGSKKRKLLPENVELEIMSRRLVNKYFGEKKGISNSKIADKFDEYFRSVEELNKRIERTGIDTWGKPFTKKHPTASEWNIHKLKK